VPSATSRTIDTDMYSASPELYIVDLYSVESEDKQRKATPFLQTIKPHGPQGEIVRLESTFNDSTMVSAINLQWFQQVEHHLKSLRRSNQILCMANGQLIPSTRAWTGDVTIGGVSHKGTFEVFDSNGAWVVLSSKPLLQTCRSSKWSITMNTTLAHKHDRP
jgi:hypothetical protein